jgi:hypothetical protein
MFKQAKNYVFLLAVYLSGILVGGIYTPDVISYMKQFDVFKNAEQEQTEKKPQLIKKKKKKIYVKGLA